MEIIIPSYSLIIKPNVFSPKRIDPTLFGKKKEKKTLITEQEFEDIKKEGVGLEEEIEKEERELEEMAREYESELSVIEGGGVYGMGGEEGLSKADRERRQQEKQHMIEKRLSKKGLLVLNQQNSNSILDFVNSLNKEDREEVMADDNDRWIYMYHRFVDFYNKYRRLPTKKSDNEDEKSIAKWVDRQLTLKYENKLEKYYIDTLTMTVGWSWDVVPESKKWAKEGEKLFPRPIYEPYRDIEVVAVSKIDSDIAYMNEMRCKLEIAVINDILRALNLTVMHYVVDTDTLPILREKLRYARHDIRMNALRVVAYILYNQLNLQKYRNIQLNDTTARSYVIQLIHVVNYNILKTEPYMPKGLTFEEFRRTYTDKQGRPLAEVRRKTVKLIHLESNEFFDINDLSSMLKHFNIQDYNLQDIYTDGMLNKQKFVLTLPDDVTRLINIIVLMYRDNGIVDEDNREVYRKALHFFKKSLSYGVFNHVTQCYHKTISSIISEIDIERVFTLDTTRIKFLTDIPRYIVSKLISVKTQTFSILQEIYEDMLVKTTEAVDSHTINAVIEYIKFINEELIENIILKEGGTNERIQRLSQIFRSNDYHNALNEYVVRIMKMNTYNIFDVIYNTSLENLIKQNGLYENIAYINDILTQTIASINAKKTDNKLSVYHMMMHYLKKIQNIYIEREKRERYIHTKIIERVDQVLMQIININIEQSNSLYFFVNNLAFITIMLNNKHFNKLRYMILNGKINLYHLITTNTISEQTLCIFPEVLVLDKKISDTKLIVDFNGINFTYINTKIEEAKRKLVSIIYDARTHAISYDPTIVADLPIDSNELANVYRISGLACMMNPENLAIIPSDTYTKDLKVWAFDANYLLQLLSSNSNNPYTQRAFPTNMYMYVRGAYFTQ